MEARPDLVPGGYAGAIFCGVRVRSDRGSQKPRRGLDAHHERTGDRHSDLPRLERRFHRLPLFPLRPRCSYPFGNHPLGRLRISAACFGDRIRPGAAVGRRSHRHLCLQSLERDPKRDPCLGMEYVGRVGASAHDQLELRMGPRATTRLARVGVCRRIVRRRGALDAPS